MDTQQGSGIRIDCGEGTQHQIMRSTDIKITKIRFSSISLILIPMRARTLEVPVSQGKAMFGPLLTTSCVEVQGHGSPSLGYVSLS